jgi:hypothetical protein
MNFATIFATLHSGSVAFLLAFTKAATASAMPPSPASAAVAVSHSETIPASVKPGCR